MTDPDAYIKNEIHSIFGGEPPESIRDYIAAVPPLELYMAYRLARMIGPGGAFSLASMGIWLTRGSAPTEAEHARIIDAVEAMIKGSPPTLPEDEALHLSYAAILTGRMSRAKAAEIASEMLRPPKPISTDAWRKRVDRWAEQKGLEPLGRRRQAKS